MEAYGVDALQYLVKPLEKERFFHAMDIVLKQMKKAGEDQIVIKVAGGGIRQMTTSSTASHRRIIRCCT